MKSVVLEKHETKNQDEPISQTILAFVVHRDSNAENDDSFFGQNSLKSGVFSTVTLVEEVKPGKR